MRTSSCFIHSTWIVVSAGSVEVEWVRCLEHPFILIKDLKMGFQAAQLVPSSLGS